MQAFLSLQSRTLTNEVSTKDSAPRDVSTGAVRSAQMESSKKRRRASFGVQRISAHIVAEERQTTVTEFVTETLLPPSLKVEPTVPDFLKNKPRAMVEEIQLAKTSKEKRISLQYQAQRAMEVEMRKLYRLVEEKVLFLPSCTHCAYPLLACEGSLRTVLSHN